MPTSAPIPTPDELWKELIERLPDELCAFLLPETYPHIDWDKPPISLEQEMHHLFPDSEESQRYNDKLFRVHLKNGDEKWLLVHIEVQGYSDKSFPWRMFTYFYRARDRYGVDMESIALFTDKYPGETARPYHYRSETVELHYQYRMFKLIDQSLEELEARSDNLFALALLAARYMLEEGHDKVDTLRFKQKLFRLMLAKGHGRKSIEKLFIFIDYIVKLPAPEQEAFHKTVRTTLKQEETMPLSIKDTPTMRSILAQERKEGEEIGERKGEQQATAREKQKREAAIRNMRNEGIGIDVIARVFAISEAEVRRILGM